MNFGEMFPSNYLTQDDFPAPRVLIMKGVAMEELRRPGGKTQTKPVMHFATGKPMVLNKTNGQVIAKKYGRDSLKWAGQPIEVYFDPTVKMGKDEVGGLRVRIPAAGAKAETPHVYTPDEVHSKLLREYALAATQEHADQWAGWATKRGFKFSEEQIHAQADAYQKMLQRLSLLKPQTQTANGAPTGLDTDGGEIENEDLDDSDSDLEGEDLEDDFDGHGFKDNDKDIPF